MLDLESVKNKGVMKMNKEIYDRESAVAYARKWALGRNPDYMDYHGIGGDCANFVSQCMYAGGAPQNYTPDTGWYYNTPNDRAAAWTGVEYMYKFLTSNHKIGPKGRVIPLEEIQIGDVIQLSYIKGLFSHSLFVIETGKIPTPENVLIAAHTDDSLDRPFSTYHVREYRCLHITV